MTRLASKSLRKDFLTSLPFLSLTSLLYIISFPKLSWWVCSLFAFVPLLRCIDNSQKKIAFLDGFFSGTLAYVGFLYWIVPTFTAAGLSPFFGGLACLALSLFLGIYWGVFSFLAHGFLKRFTSSVAILFCAVLWVALEYLRTHLFTGFPWGVLGYAFWNVPSLIQISEWTGVYGVSFLIILFNFNLYFLLKRKIVWAPWILFSALVGANFFLLPKEIKTIGGQTITILQGNIDQYKKWSEVYVREIMNTYEDLVLKHSDGSDLILWPESALPGWFPEEGELSDWIKNLVKKTKRPHLVGSVTDYERSYNSAFLFSAEGTVLDRYDKSHLVPFGEFIPLPFLFGKMAPLTQLGNFSKGNSNKTLKMHPFKFGVTVCYEAIFPNLVRKQVKLGANLLVNITNDGWYLNTAAPYQHFSMNVFRAVENRRYLVRAANTGISGMINPSGKIGTVTQLNKKTAIKVHVSPEEKLTFYSQYGDLFAIVCSLLSLTAIISSFPRKRESSQANLFAGFPLPDKSGQVSWE